MGTLLQCNIDIETKRHKKKQKDRRKIYPDDLKRGDGEVWGKAVPVSSRCFDLLNLMIYDLKRSVDLR